MTRTPHAALHSTWILAAFLCAACTGGHVSKDGSPVANADVSIWTCDAIGDYTTTTDASGNYRFNPFSPNSPAFDSDEYIPDGPIAIHVTGAAGSSVTRRNHQYDDECPIAYNGATQNLPCKVQNVNLVPMTLPEFFEAQAAFLEEDCGLSARAARHLSAAALGNDLGPLGKLTTEPPRVSCISRCTASCNPPNTPVGDFSACMCICVEGNCGATFGPFCAESG